EAPVATPARRRRQLAAPSIMPTNQLLEQAFPSWARVRAGDANLASGAAFRAGAGLALLDQILRANPAFAGALRQRLALRAAAACASMLRLREDASALRDAEHLAGPGADPGPAGRLHRLWRGLASESSRLDASGFLLAAEVLGSPRAIDVEALTLALKNLATEKRDPLRLAAQAASLIAQALPDAPRMESEILGLWAADLVLAARIGWERPVPLLATKILDVSLRRGPNGKRPRPGDPDWAETVARATALAACEAHTLAVDLARRSDRLLSALPKLRAKSAGRVIDMLLADDAVTPAKAARTTKLSDRAARRLFDRLIELGAVRELSGRPNFRLYGL
ncbi:MAG: DUF1403 family protein, partial [Methylocystis sp.]